MACRVSTLLPRVAAFIVPFAFVAGCVEDIRTEGEVKAPPGATQPEGNGVSISAEDACERLREAENDARREMRCEASPLPGCPERLRLAGSLVCAEVDEGSVDACVEVYSGYRFCEDLDARPCIVTVIRSTCENPYEAGAPPPDSGPPPDGSLDGGQPEGSVPPLGEAGTPDAAPPEAGPPPISEAGAD